MKTLYDYQDREITRLQDEEAVFLAWETGVGKTLATVEWVKRKAGVRTVIVVLPSNTRRSWTRTIEEQIPGVNVFNLASDKKNIISFGALKAQTPGWYLITWEMMRTGAITGQHGDVVVADETHRQANYGKSWQAILIREISSTYRVALSGTPAGNRPEYIFSTMNWLWPKRYAHYYKNFVDEFWLTRRNGSIIDFIREKQPNMIVNHMPAFSRVRARDHRDDLPPVLPEIQVEVELTPAQRKIYRQFDEKSLAWLDDSPVPTAYSLSKELRLRQVALGVPTVVTDEKGNPEVTFKLTAKSSKIEALLDIISDQPQEDTFLVLTHSAKFVPVVVEQLRKKGIRAEKFTGETKQAVRDRLIDELGTSYRVLVAGIHAIAEGTDGLQHVCHNLVWLSKHPSALLNKQGAGRLDRPGQEFPINVWNIFAKDTNDERSLERLDEVEGNLATMLDGDKLEAIDTSDSDW